MEQSNAGANSDRMVTSFRATQVIGINFWCLMGQLAQDLHGTLSLVKEWNLHHIELGEQVVIPADDISALAKAYDLTVISMGFPFEVLRDSPETALIQARSFGARYAVCHGIPHLGLHVSEPEMEDAIKVLTVAGRVFRDSGLSLCYHTEGYEFSDVYGCSLFEHLVTSTDPALLNFELDPYWVEESGNSTITLLQSFPNRFPLMHLRDRRSFADGRISGMSPLEASVALGKGDLELESILKQAIRSGVKVYFIEDESAVPEKQIPESLIFLENLAL